MFITLIGKQLLLWISFICIFAPIFPEDNGCIIQHTSTYK